MKKIIALVLTVMMLASTLVVGISAARYSEYTPANGEPITLSTKFVASESNGRYSEESAINGVTDGYTFTLVAKSDTGYGWQAKKGETVGYIAGTPVINMDAGTLSYNGGSNTLNYAFEDNTVYTIKYVVDGDTTVYVNGENIGVLSGAPQAMFYGTVYRLLVREMTFEKDGAVFAGFKADDYNKDDEVEWLGGARVIEETKKVVAVYEDQDVKYVKCDSHGHFQENALRNDDFTLKVVLKTPSAYYDELGELTMWYGKSATFNMKNGTISYGGASGSVNYTFAMDTEYTIEWVVDGDTTIFVNGEKIGTLAGAMGAQIYGAFYRCFVKEVSFTENGEQFDGFKAADLGEKCAYLADADVVSVKESVFVRYDPYIPASYVNENRYSVHKDAVVDGKAWQASQEDDGNSYMQGETTMFSDGDWGKPHDYILDFDIRLDREDGHMNSLLGDSSGKLGGFVGSIQFNKNTIGVGNATTNQTFDFEVGRWYHIQFNSAFYESQNIPGSLVYVDGALISSVNGGVINGMLASRLIDNAAGVSIDNFVAKALDGTVLYSDDMEDGRFNLFDSNGNGSVVDKVIIPAEDKNFAHDLGLYYWLWDEDNQYAYINGLDGDKAAKWEFDLNLGANRDSRSYFGNDPIFHAQVTEKEDVKYVKCDSHGHFQENALRNDDFTLKVVLKTPSAYYDELGELTMWYGKSATFNMKNGTISYGGASGSVNYTFAMDTEYTIEWVVDGDTTIFVNGEKIGTLAGAMGAQIYGAFYRCFVKEVSFTENGEQFDGFKAADLGEKCAYLADADVVAVKEEIVKAGAIGVGSTTVEYPFAVDTWYHIVLDGSAGNGTDVYVDGVLVGHVDNTIKATWCGKPGENIGIDNLKITADGIDYFEDFEDQTFGSTDGNGYAQAYAFDYEPPVPEYPVYHFITTETPGGEAYLVKGGYNYELGNIGADNASAYYDMDTAINPGRSEYVINFDLALIPETDTTGATYFEIWSDIAYKRWIVGTTFTGFNAGTDGTEDYKSFDWGEATKDNFHNVTYIFRNRVGQILVDGELVYEGKCGDTWKNMMIGNVYNGSAILDNVQLFKFTDANEAQPNELEALEVRMASDEDVKVINLDAEDFCAANGHIQHHTVRTTEPFCEDTGVDTTYCAICGEVAKTTEVPALGHSYPGYYSATTVDGVRTFACRRGCGKTWSTTVPTPVAGRLDLFLDFADAEVVQKIADIFNADKEVVEDGIGKFLTDCEQNYNEFKINDSSLRNQYTVAFDFKVNGLFDTDATDDYGHGAWFWFGGDSGIGNEAGYDFEKNEFFVRPWNSSAYEEIRVPAKISKDTWHQLMFKVYAPGEESEENWMKIYLDGEEVLVFDEWFDTTYYLPTTQNICIIRDFGVAADIDNFAIGSIDLELTAKRNVGDLTGDTKITTKDLKVLKLALAGKYTLNAAEETAADINGDGKINLDDLAAMKRLLAGA